MDKRPCDFVSSLEQLTCDDLAPKSKKGINASGLFFRGLWLLMIALCLCVALWSSVKVAENLFDFITAEENYNSLASEFSPVTGNMDRPLRLKPGAESYPLAHFDQMQSGNAVYPQDEDPPTDLPPVNPGSEPTPLPTPSPSPTPTPSVPPSPSKDPSPAPTPSPSPSTDQEEPDEQPLQEEDPLLSSDMYEQFCEKLSAMQGQYKNEDIFAWIYIPGTNINYPIVQTNNNDYYLTRDVSKTWNTAGSIYMDYRNNENLLENPFSVIYGHNIRTKGTMFNRLLELLKEEQFDRCRYVYIYTKEAALKYEIFSVYSADASESPTISIPTQNNAAFLEKIKDIQNKSIHRQRNITLYESDHVVLLYTCSNTQSATERVFVAGVLVGIGT